MFYTHIIDDQQVQHEILGKYFILAVQGFVTEEVPYNIKYRALFDSKACLDCLIADSLYDVAFTGAGWL